MHGPLGLFLQTGRPGSCSAADCFADDLVAVDLLHTFASAPAPGTAITAGFEFDVPVRFDTDSLSINLANFAAGEVPSLPLVEVRI